MGGIRSWSACQRRPNGPSWHDLGAREGAPADPAGRLHRNEEPIPGIVKGIADRNLARFTLIQRPTGHLREDRPASEPRPLLNVMMPAADGSLGDELLVLGTQALAVRASRSAAFLMQGPAPSLQKQGLHEVVDSTSMVTLASSRLTEAGRTRIESADLIVIGADTISGDYEHRFLGSRVESLNLAVQSGHSGKLVNSSVTARPTPLSTRILRRLDDRVEVWARDRPSQHALEESLGRRVGLSPDVGCLVAARDAGAFDPDARYPERGFAVVVPNAHFSTHLRLDERAIIDAWSSMAKALPLPVVVMPHDLRAFPGDVELARRLAAASDAALYVPADAADAKHVLSRAALCVSARMHACVGALSSGTPTVGLEYLDKFRGQFDWYGALGRVVRQQDVGDASAIVGAVASLGAPVEQWTVPEDWFKRCWL